MFQKMPPKKTNHSNSSGNESFWGFAMNDVLDMLRQQSLQATTATAVDTTATTTNPVATAANATTILIEGAKSGYYFQNLSVSETPRV